VKNFFWRQGETYSDNFFARSKLFLSPAGVMAMLAWLHTTELSIAFDSIWHSALIHQLIALDFPLSFVVYIYSFLSDRWAEIIFCGTGSRSFSTFSKFLLSSNFSYYSSMTSQRPSPQGPISPMLISRYLVFFYRHTQGRSWKDSNRPSYLYRHRVKHSVFTSNLFEMQIVHQIIPPYTTPNLFSSFYPRPFL